MMDCIDRDLLLKDIGESVVFTVKSGFISPEMRGARKVIDRIENAPTADVAEVKHGEWEDLYNSRYDNPLYVCSKCNCRALRTNEKDELGHIKCSQELSPYCPHCGAKMDGGVK